jgi:superfamily I DNA/RNA helicase
LYRTNSQSRLFEEALRRLRIEYNIVGGFSFYERAEVKDIVAYLKLALNPVRRCRVDEDNQFAGTRAWQDEPGRIAAAGPLIRFFAVDDNGVDHRSCIWRCR